MKHVAHEWLDSPIISSTGEKIFEMIGLPDKLGGSKNISVAKVVLDPGVSSPRHTNQGAEVYIMIEGIADIYVNTFKGIMYSGDVLYIAPQEPHQIVNNTVVPVKFYVISAPAWRAEDQTIL